MVLFIVLLLTHHQLKSIIKMKLKAILICMLATFVNMQAQTSAPTNPIVLNQGNITGKVIDKRNSEALPYASVTVKEEGKVISWGGLIVTYPDLLAHHYCRS